MTDIDALIERLKNTSEDLFYATPCTAKLMCEQAAAALERMRGDSTALRARLAEVEGALREVISVSDRKTDIYDRAKAALASAGVTEQSIPSPITHRGGAGR